jgi:hypothetical protein
VVISPLLEAASSPKPPARDSPLPALAELQRSHRHDQAAANTSVRALEFGEDQKWNDRKQSAFVWRVRLFSLSLL